MHEHPLVILEVLDVGDDLPDLDSAVGLTMGACTVGLERNLRKSVYAVGGVMGVFSRSSFLMTSVGPPGSGLRGSSDGNEADRGVSRRWRVGLTEAMMFGLADTARERERGR